MARIGAFLKDVKTEMMRVAWPTRGETVRSTANVILMSLVVAAFLALCDLVFVNALKAILQ